MTEEMRKQSFAIQKIVIDKGYYDDKPFTAQVHLKGSHSYTPELKLELNEQRTLAIIELISDLLVAGMDAFVSDMLQDARQLAATSTTPLLEGEKVDG
jgi:hypothetical protein